ncbi:MAG: dephospho-CoA kinase, partial [Nitratireductor sp.]|nr:dephospho-CoA kinase [Nitratireductor sp.]
MTRPLLLGLTGSIGMGKSTTARMFADEGVPVWDADAAVHRLYARAGAGTAAIAEIRPEAVVDGAVDRARLKDWIAADTSALARIEAAIHPLVAADRAAFIARARDEGAKIVLLDI